MRTKTFSRVGSSRGIIEQIDPEPLDYKGSAGLFVGIRHFEKRREFKSITYAVDDAVDLAYLFSCDLGLLDPSRLWLAVAGVPEKEQSRARLRMLKEAGSRIVGPTRSTILRQLHLLGDQTTRNGLMIVSFATHGFSDGTVHQLAAHDSVRGILEDTGVGVPRILKSLKGGKAQRKMLIVDACRELLVDRSSRGASTNISAAFAEAFKQAKGLVSMVAAPEGALAFDDHKKGNGVFSAAILDGLRGNAAEASHGFITPATLLDYVEESVGAWYREQDLEDPGIASHAEGKLRSLPLASRDPSEIERRRLRERRDFALAHLDEYGTRPLRGEHRDRVREELQGDIGEDQIELMAEIEQLDGTSRSSRALLWWLERHWRENENGGAQALFYRGLIRQYGLADNSVDFEQARRQFSGAAERGGPIERMWWASLLHQGTCGMQVDRGLADQVIAEELDALERLVNAGGNVEAIFVWGVAQSHGLGCSVDLKLARWCFEGVVEAVEKSADQMGLLASVARLYLGWLVSLKDQPDGPSYHLGLTYFRRSAIDGNVVAMRNIGQFYEQGWGVEKDVEQARSWYLKAAERGHSQSMVRLGQAARHGTWGETSTTEAIDWFERAAKAGDSEAMYELGTMFLDLEPANVPAGVDWLERSMALGNLWAMRYLGAIYADGNFVPQDFAKTVELWQHAAELGDRDAMDNLAELAAQLGDLPAAHEWLRRAAEAGVVDCMVKYGLALASGKVVPVDLVAAAGWYQRAAEAGSAWGMGNLAICYFNGQGVPLDHYQAAVWHSRAAEAGNTLSMYYLGQHLLGGLGVEQDVEAGKLWIARAKASGLDVPADHAPALEPSTTWLGWLKKLLS